MRAALSSSAFLAVLAACSPAPGTIMTVADAPVTLELVWRLGGFAGPESVAPSADGSFLYVSNVNGGAADKDGNGFISKVSTDGKMLERNWSEGLDGPKGLALGGDRLYAADVTQLVTIDAGTGEIIARTPLEGAKFLNDVAVAPDGRVLVADSDNKRIYAFKDGVSTIWVEDDLLTSINGLLTEPDRLLVATMAGRLLAMDYATGAITVLAEGLGDMDTVAPWSGGRFLTNEWPGLFHVVNADGTRTTIMDTRNEKRALNDFVLVGDSLYQPHWDPGEVTAYRVADRAP